MPTAPIPPRMAPMPSRSRKRPIISSAGRYPASTSRGSTALAASTEKRAAEATDQPMPRAPNWMALSSPLVRVLR